MKRWSKVLLSALVSMIMIVNASVVAFATSNITLETDPDGAGTISQVADGGAISVVNSVPSDAHVSLIQSANNGNTLDRYKTSSNNS